MAAAVKTADAQTIPANSSPPGNSSCGVTRRSARGSSSVEADDAAVLEETGPVWKRAPSPNQIDGLVPSSATG